MPNRVIKDSIWSSPTLAKISEKAQLHWLRWLLQPDDWGCFNADEDIIKGLVYPKMKSVTPKKVLELRDEYNQAGLLFLWSENGRVWGYFVTFSNHHFCNSTHVNGEGKQARHKRRTPEPPQNELDDYLNDIKQVLTGKLERVRTFKDKYRIPIPNPNHNPIPNPNHNPDIYSRVVTHLNEVSGSKYKSTTPKTKELIKARQLNGFSLGDFFTVIDKKVAEWKNTEQAKYLRPETLFGTKFEGYLNQLEVRQGGSRVSDHNDQVAESLKRKMGVGHDTG